MVTLAIAFQQFERFHEHGGSAEFGDLTGDESILVDELRNTILNTPPNDLPDVAAILQLVRYDISLSPSWDRWMCALARAEAFVDRVAPFQIGGAS